MTKYFLLLFIFPVLLSAQILQEFPRNQFPYKGGYENYYKDFHDIIVEKKLQPCSNKGEIYEFKVLINEDNTISFIKDYSSDYIARNKCAYDLACEVAKHQTN